MDYQVLFDIAMSVIAACVGWILGRITKSLDMLDKDVRSMPGTYVNKADYNRDIDRVLEKLDQIFAKLDGKADKP